jgi:hypothetical protein
MLGNDLMSPASNGNVIGRRLSSRRRWPEASVRNRNKDVHGNVSATRDCIIRRRVVYRQVKVLGDSGAVKYFPYEVGIDYDPGWVSQPMLLLSHFS